MEIPSDSYCRLCAQLTPVNLVYKLKYDRLKSLDIMKKLTQLKESFASIFFNTKLPDTICIQCLESLDKSVEFVQRVENSQNVLEQIFGLMRPYKSYSETKPSHYTIGVEVSGHDEDSDSSGDAETPACKARIKKEADIKKEFQMGSDDSSSNPPYEEMIIPSFETATEESPVNLSWADYTWRCAICVDAFPSMEELRAHSISQHQTCSAFRCIDCNAHKIKFNDFIVHVLGHRKYLVKFCPICDMDFEVSSENIASHRSCHAPHEHVCVGCNMSFERPQKLRDHKKAYCVDQRLTKRAEKDDNACRICGKVLSTRATLRHHLAAHRGRSRDYICDVCGKSFYTKDTLACHFRVHTDTRPHACKICLMSFKRIGQLRTHIATHSQARPYTCEVCGKSYKTEKMLKSHSLLHTEEPKFVCEICEKRFRAKTVLMRHYRQHTGDKPYACEKCGKTFADRSNYGKHIKRRHGVEIAKKKYTPKGFFPVNPQTGQPEIAPLAPDTDEWQKRVLTRRKIKTNAAKVKAKEGLQEAAVNQ